MGNNNRNEKNNKNSRNNDTRQVKFKRIKKRPCSICAANIIEIDYKESNSIKRYMTDRGKIAPRRNSGLCPRHQREIAKVIKKSRIIGLVPYIVD